jgi:hypothetical protein
MIVAVTKPAKGGVRTRAATDACSPRWHRPPAPTRTYPQSRCEDLPAHPRHPLPARWHPPTADQVLLAEEGDHMAVNLLRDGHGSHGKAPAWLCFPLSVWSTKAREHA